MSTTRSATARRVYLTLPTGARVHFNFAPTSIEVDGQTFYNPAWQGGFRRHLHPASVADVLTKAGNRYYDLATGEPYNPASPFFKGPSYTLTGPDGTHYQLDAQGNITGEITPSGAQLYISNSGITAANGARSSSCATPRAGSRASSPPTASSSPISTTRAATWSPCKT